jgi:hypothetical protein
MADYYTNFSVIVGLPNHEAQTYALQLHERMQEETEDETRPEDLPELLWACREDWHFECVSDGTEEKPSLWLHSSNGSIDAACAFIQHLLQRFELQEAVSLEWSNDCSKPRTDAYGGGAAFITAKSIRTFTTGEWISRQRQRCQRLNPH